VVKNKLLTPGKTSGRHRYRIKMRQINIGDHDNKNALSIFRTRFNVRTYVLVAIIGSVI